MSGMDMMMQSLIKASGIDPNKIMEIAGQFQTTLLAFKAQMDRIEAQNETIIHRLNQHVLGEVDHTFANSLDKSMRDEVASNA